MNSFAMAEEAKAAITAIKMQNLMEAIEIILAEVIVERLYCKEVEFDSLSLDEDCSMYLYV